MPGRMRKKHVSPEVGYDLYAPYYKADHDYLDSFDWPPAQKELVRLLKPEDLVLDLGSGDGRIYQRILRTHPSAMACDISQRMLDILGHRVKDKSRLVRCDASRLPFRPESFDLIYAFFLIVHIDRLDPFFNEVLHILKPGGFLILNNIPQHNSPILKAGEEKIVIESSYHSDRQVISSAETAGFFLESAFEEIQKETKVSTVFSFKK